MPPKRPAPITQPADEHHETMTPVDAARCEELSWILEHVSIGSWRDMRDATRLRELGVTHVLNVAKEVDPNGHCDVSRFSTKHIPLVDAYNENLFARLEEACTFIEQCRREDGKVLVHCRRGISRSPTIVVAYLMRHREHSFEEAFDFVKARRSCISLNMSFREALSHYSPRTVGSSLVVEMRKAELRQFHQHGADEDDDEAAAHDGLAPPNMSVFSDDEGVSSNTARTTTGSSNVSQQDQHHHQPLIFYTPPHLVVVAQAATAPTQSSMNHHPSAYTELEEESGA